ncbi:LytTR family DNA-binding domain-containing protein [Terrimonas sp. NA20]|uniref:LytTR family DNA-binding domain-containing protein n=1 Tax=Terrimonas ginsenosidimutans TaxID=2908004 RepID=A0ABS9KN92_9BACT|nr:LytTR family DNA-binding domain-containing protein [Terrimonas ginsenosidimutans]MCG2613783.1 LytTR family DNA-binding domain-containing protein [Terrimonas ginsenosidimutans]
MPRSYRCIIVDDDEIDRLTTLSFARQFPFLNISVFGSATEALPAIRQELPDVAFLDVDMPGMTGLELRREFLQIPACVFITAYPDYAVESFDLAALDFMVKPIKAERFRKTIDRIQEFLEVKHKATLLDHTLGADTIFIKDGHKQVKLNLHEIIYLEALKDYTSIVTTSGKHCVLSSIGNLLKEPGFHSFLRIHRSYAVQKNFVASISANEVTVGNIQLPIGRNYKEALADLKQ